MVWMSFWHAQMVTESRRVRAAATCAAVREAVVYDQLTRSDSIPRQFKRTFV